MRRSDIFQPPAIVCKGVVLCKPGNAGIRRDFPVNRARRDNMRFKPSRMISVHHLPAAAVAGTATVLLILAIMAVAIVEMLPK